MKMNFRGGLERNWYRSCHILPPPDARRFKTLPLFTIYLSVSWYYLQFSFQRRKWGSEMMGNCPGSHTDRAALEPSFLWPQTQDHTTTPLQAAEGLMLRPLWFEDGQVYLPMYELLVLPGIPGPRLVTGSNCPHPCKVPEQHMRKDVVQLKNWVSVNSLRYLRGGQQSPATQSCVMLC